MESAEPSELKPSVKYKRAPNSQTLEFLATTNCRTIAEVGVERGSTADGILRWLNGRGMLHLFDFEDQLVRTGGTLRERGFSNFVTHGNSRCTLDSYNWSLMRLLSDNPEPIFDYIYLDGAHPWAHDALAFLRIDLLLQPGGYVDFDDYHWTIDESRTVNPRIKPVMSDLYTEEQIKTPQVKIIVDLLVPRRGTYEEVVANNVFCKRKAGGLVSLVRQALPGRGL